MRILVVEDEAKVAQALAEGLTSEGYSVATASTGEEAFFRANSESFDLVEMVEALRVTRGLERGLSATQAYSRPDDDGT